MKRLVVLTAVVLLSAASLGCRCTNPFSRGPSCPTCGQAGMSAYGGGAAYGGEAFGAPGGGMPGEYVMPGPQ
jgi:hypothetical protein